jgi:large subunit ribosomal protein L13
MTHMKRNKLHTGVTMMLRKEDCQPKWIIIDAKGKVLGRLASEIAKVLRGKHKPTYTPHIDSGDGVIIINADQIRVTGRKEAQKVYRRYTGYIGGMRETPYRVMQARKPCFIIEHAVKGMVPRTRIGRKQMKRLRIFAGDQHKMQAQQAINVNV